MCDFKSLREKGKLYPGGLLFYIIFSEKRDLLELYNALNYSSYHDVKKLRVEELKGALYLAYENDVIFLVEDITKIFDDYLKQKFPLVSRGYPLLWECIAKQLPILPMPEHCVFYYGEKTFRETSYLTLNDIIKEENNSEPTNCEYTTTAINLNARKNATIKTHSKRLTDYQKLVSMLRNGLTDEDTPRDKISSIINMCINNNILSDILSKNKEEIIDIIFDEYLALPQNKEL